MAAVVIEKEVKARLASSIPVCQFEILIPSNAASGMFIQIGAKLRFTL